VVVVGLVEVVVVVALVEVVVVVGLVEAAGETVVESCAAAATP